MKDNLHKYHGDRWSMKGSFANISRIAGTLPKELHDKVKQLQEEMQTKLKERYEKSKSK